MITYKHFKSNKITMYVNSILVAQLCYEKDSSAPALFISHLDVKPKHQRKGYGTILLNKVMEEFKDRVAITLMVNVNNQGAIKLYHRLGFFICMTSYNSPENYYFMTRKSVPTH